MITLLSLTKYQLFENRAILIFVNFALSFTTSVLKHHCHCSL